MKHLLTWIYFGLWWVVVRILWLSVSGGGWWWVVVDIFWLVLGGGGWQQIYFGWWWTVVGVGGYILAGGGWQWVVVGRGIVQSNPSIFKNNNLDFDSLVQFRTTCYTAWKSDMDAEETQDWFRCSLCMQWFHEACFEQ